MSSVDSETMELEEEEEEGHRLDGVLIPPAPPTRSDVVTGELIITEMICENFKSYAGLQQLGPFHPSFNAVIGPNGSGKSNVIDAMLFVFGYRASKIRSKKISVLIHSSSEHPGLKQCSVTVVFLNPKDGERLYVKRTAFKDNSSFYEVNGKKKPFKEVASLLRLKGIDLDHNRFLILQGEVEQISLMKPKAQVEGSSETGMLEFLEDIIGSSRLKEPIETFKERNAELDTLRTEKLNRVKLVEKEKDDLEGPKNEAIEYLRKENQVTNLKNQEYQVEAHRCGLKLEDHQGKKEEFLLSSKEVLERIEKISQERSTAEESLKSLKKEQEDTSNHLEDLREKLKNHELEDSKVMEEMKLVNVKRKKIIGQSKAEKERYEKLLTVPEENKKKIEECIIFRDKHAESVEMQQAKYDEAVQNIKAETQEIQDKKESHETELIELKKTANEKASKVKVAKSKLELEESNEKKERNKLEALKISLEKAKERIKDKSSESESAITQIPELKQSLESLNGEIAHIAGKVDKYQERVKSSRILYEESKSNYQASKSRGRVHGSLMEQKASGRIPGIFGRLGDLGAIDQKYDVAVSTAGGSSLDTIIVDNVETGKACINFLRKNDIGRANFLALDKTDCWKQHCGNDFRAPEGVPRLFDLIKVGEPKFKPAFYHYLRNTLVAQDMVQAQRIAFGRERFRVVTVDGEVIEKSGAMSGGGREKARGKIGSQVTCSSSSSSSANIAELEKTLKERDELLSEALATKRDLEQRQIKLGKELASLEESQAQWSLEQGQMEQEVKILKRSITDQTKVVNELKTDEKKLAELRSQVEALEEESQEASLASKKVEDVVDKLNKQIKDIMGSKVKAVKVKLEEAKSMYEKMKKEITRLEVGIKSSDRDIEKSKDKFTNYDAEVSECETRMREMKASREALEKDGRELIDGMEELKASLKEKITQHENHKKDFEVIKEEEKKVKSSRIEIEEKLSFYESSIKEETRNIAIFKKHLDKLSLIEVPGDDAVELVKYSPQDLESMDFKKIHFSRTVIEEDMGKMKPNLAVIAEFQQKESVYLDRIAELNELTVRRDKQKKNYEDIRKMRLNEFMEGFSVITSKLKEMYQMITLGGDAELELVDSLDPFTEGIVFSVRPPKKSWKNISNLSGGEKTLSSLALVFALHYYKPTPLYVMDEIDAALDFKNVSIIANYIKERTKNVQFIIISLRSNMFELAERLVGIYKIHNATKSIALDPNQFVPKANNKSTASTANNKTVVSNTTTSNVLQTPVKNNTTA
eukprot:TRINITY_DN2421_c0_g1_i1.p1 TRINITY_DN2421_c0_g1~~TRINITY_DN2421_c0_g1_i1.p1  ORF type:complete len:1275 (-),score=567.41 TRINITY_DN2421_c0_g1_i1:128-3952(-)